MSPLARRMTGFLVVVLFSVSVVSCGTTGPSATAAVTITPTQSPISPTPCPPEHCGSLTGQMEVITSVTVRETAGVGGQIRKVTLAIRRQSDNAQIAGTEEGQGVRFAGGGSVVVPFAMHYDQTQGEHNMKVTVALEAGDDNGHTVTASTEIEVITAGASQAGALRHDLAYR